MKLRVTLRQVSVALFGAVLASSARAETIDEIATFYRSRPITIKVGYSAASAYDLMARALAAYLGHHLPGHPSVIVVNAPGAGSLSTANRAYNVMPRDGTALAVVNRSIFMEPLSGDAQALFDPAKFSWIAKVADETSVCVSWHASKIKQWSDLFADDFVVVANSMSSDTGVYANVLRRFFGARVEIVVGYPGGAQITQPIESGEVDGRCGWSWSAMRSSKPDWIADKAVNFLVQLGFKSDPALKEVPVIYDLASTDEQRQALNLILRSQDVAWPILGPPGIAPDRLQALQAGFDATMGDPDFVRDAAKIGIDVRPKTGAEVQEIVRSVYQTPPAIVDEVKKVLNP